MANLRSVLEAALVENPDDLAAHMAYGDYLNEQGDPRGEFIQTQIALEDPSRTPAQRKELTAREQELFAAHKEAWLGPIHALFGKSGWQQDPDPFGIHLYDANRFVLKFSRGWLETLHLAEANPDLIEAVADCPVAKLVRDFAIDDQDYDAPADHLLENLPFLGNVLRFRFGPEADSCHISGPNIVSALKKMTRLEELSLYAHEINVDDVFALPMPNLRSLTVHHLRSFPLNILGDNPTLGNLLSVSFWPHGLEPGDAEAYIQAGPFCHMIRSPHLKSLSELHIYLSEIGDAGILALIESGKLRQMRILDLWNGRVSDVGVRAMVASPDFRNVQTVRLSGNMLTNAGIALLRETGVKLEADNMHDCAEDDDEKSYLWEGDPE